MRRTVTSARDCVRQQPIFLEIHRVCPRAGISAMRSLADSPLSSGTHSPSPDRIPMTEVLPAIGDCSIDSTATLFHREPAVIGPITATLIHASIAASTRRAYQGALERLDAWLDGRVPDDHALSEWIAVLHDRGLSVSSVSLVVGAARFRAKMSGMENPAGPMTARTLAGIRRSSIGRGRGQVAGVTWEEADLVVDRAMGEGTIRGLRDAALIAVGSDALLRVGEMVAIDVRDIERDPDGSAILHVRRSKTDQEGMGATCYLGRRTVEVLDAWMAAAGIDGNGPGCAVFRSVRKGGAVGGRLSCRSVRSIVIRRCGRGNERISGHSLRVGSAISLARAGASLVELQQAGRWKSPEMPARYTRGESARRGPVARLRHGQFGERRWAADDDPDICGIPVEPLEDVAPDAGEHPAPEDGLTPGIRFNGRYAPGWLVSILPVACTEAQEACETGSPSGWPDVPGADRDHSLIPFNRIIGTNEISNMKPNEEITMKNHFHLAAMLATILILVGCGGGSGSPGIQAPPPPSGTPQPQEPNEPQSPDDSANITYKEIFETLESTADYWARSDHLTVSCGTPCTDQNATGVIVLRRTGSRQSGNRPPISILRGNSPLNLEQDFPLLDVSNQHNGHHYGSHVSTTTDQDGDIRERLSNWGKWHLAKTTLEDFSNDPNFTVLQNTQSYVIGDRSNSAPVSGQAYWNGAYSGVAFIDNPDRTGSMAIGGTANLIADLQNMTADLITDTAISGTQYPINIHGISMNTNGTLEYNRGNDRFEGAFFGPNHEEAAGVFSLYPEPVINGITSVGIVGHFSSTRD